jgi:hypothetical protein
MIGAVNAAIDLGWTSLADGEFCPACNPWKPVIGQV